MASMQSIADQLRDSVPCEDADALLDDLSFWDAMRGFDCFNGGDATFVRAYAHTASVPQTLEDWADTFNGERAVARGENWYVIGPPAIVAALDAPPDAPKIAGDAGSPTKLTAEQEYLTTCTQFVASEGERYVNHPGERNETAAQYDRLFPAVTAEVHRAVDSLGRDRIRKVPDTERWAAALSPIGPRLKAKCATAYEKVAATVSPVEGSP
ncbi:MULTISPECIES: hypothetical protein [unclassified Curtobacterium]|uniref:hypothetical protein n=1 Tax=unclassified Curtobacterium TaxID=257496 RepID=UPI00105212E3|nr:MULTISPECIES: hypothetical protein [unclassified Curtobacterium]WIE71685.1 hypothetical protein DEJ14_016120 [Curtobacterium sp. MCJR17_020]